MGDLPQTPSKTQNPQDQSTATQHVPLSSGSKEGESIAIASNEFSLKAVATEVMLPKEAIQAGLTVTHQSVPLPPQVIQAGVKTVGVHTPVFGQQGSGLQLPLSDNQIAQALNDSVQKSVRWLAEWCVRQIKVMHAVVSRKERHLHK